MPGLYASLYTGLSGIQAQQSALSVVGHNIANVNTPGYTRQRANLVANRSQLMEGQVFFGTGVNVGSVEGIRDRFIDLQIYRETSKEAGATERYSGVDAIATALGDVGDTGIAAQIQAFFQGFQDLSANPENTALRTNVVSKAQTMIDGLKSRYQILTGQRNNADEAVQNLVSQVNAITSQIADLNARVATEATPGADSDARDQRKALTDKLAGLVGIQVMEDSHGQYQISLDSGAAVLVAGKESYNLTATPGATADNYASVTSTMGVTTIDVTAKITDGQLGAKLALRDQILREFQDRLDVVAAGVASRVNQVHTAGYVYNAATGTTTAGGNFFFENGATYAATNLGLGQIQGLPTNPATMTAGNHYRGMVNALALNSAVAANPGLIAASTASGLAAQGNNANAVALGNLQFGNIIDDNVDGQPDSSYNNALASLVGRIGTLSQTYKARSDTQQNLLSALQTQRDRVSSVDLDEEATNLMTLQRGYQASARFISVINQLTDQLVNQFGR